MTLTFAALIAYTLVAGRLIIRFHNLQLTNNEQRKQDNGKSE